MPHYSEQYKFLVDVKVVISSKGVEWICKNVFKQKYLELLEKKKTASFTLTPKLWIEQTKAVGIVSKQGKSGGTFAHPMIACEFASWIAPEFKMLLLKLSLNRTKLS